jgi:hypothetical protein
MKVRNARICLNDDEVFTGETCPVCMSKTSYPLRKWLEPLEKIGGRNEKSRNALQVEPQEKLGDYLFMGDNIYMHPKHHIEFVEAAWTANASGSKQNHNAKPSQPDTYKSHHPRGITLGLEGGVFQGGDRPHAGDAVERKNEQGGSVLPREEHYRGDKDLKVFSEKQPQP